MESWENKPQVKKGTIGENKVQEYLEKNGWIVYKPDTGGPHAFDNLCVLDKKHFIIAEIKTKARMNKFEATGINTRHLKEYLFVSDKYKIEVFLFFVDEWLRKIYGNKLSILMQEYVNSKNEKYPMKIKNNEITLFSLESMVNVCALDDCIAEELKKLSTRNYNYQEVTQ